MLKTIPLFLLLLLSSCAPIRPALFPQSAESLTSPENIKIWPTQDQQINYKFHGLIKNNYLDVNIQGQIATKVDDDNTLQLVILNQFGSSIIQTEVSREDYKIYSESVLLDKIPGIRDLIIEAVQNIFFSEQIDSCKKYIAKNKLQLNCQLSGNLYAFTKTEDATNWKLENKYPNSDNVVVYKDFQDSTASIISYENSNGLIQFSLQNQP